ncbi:YceI family protein [soil metagenome]
MNKWLGYVLLAAAVSVGALAMFAGPTAALDNIRAAQTSPVLMRFEIDAARSTFMVKASRGGIAWFKGHDHHIKVGKFSGEADVTLDALNPASLRMTIDATSLKETSKDFTPKQKDIINKELDDIVLESTKYPEITFKSTDIKGSLKNGKFEVKIGGDITLHGVTRHIAIPAVVSVEGDSLHAKGGFSLNRSDFNVKATSAFHGYVRIKNKLRFTFDMVGKSK